MKLEKLVYVVIAIKYIYHTRSLKILLYLVKNVMWVFLWKISVVLVYLNESSMPGLKEKYLICFWIQSVVKCDEVYGEGNGTPLQYSCLENPMDGGAW